MDTNTAVIIGAGPAGLTAAHELLKKTDIKPCVLEMSDSIGGISQTANYKGNRIDIGGHRFFSKSDRVMEWWLQMMPLAQQPTTMENVMFRQDARQSETPAENLDPDTTDRVMLVRRRKSRIFFLRKFFDYPLRLNTDTIAKLGFSRMVKIASSYARSALFPNKNPKNLEEFFISRFGKELYLTFFKSYTEKLWGESCSQISAEWGAQRVKGLSIGRALQHFLGTSFRRSNGGLGQKTMETSLIEEFLYPKYGPGQMWEIVADGVTQRGGTVLTKQRATRLHVADGRITAVDAVDPETGQTTTHRADYVFSSMPVTELTEALDTTIPVNVQEVARGLMYRDFITVGLVLKKLKALDRNGQNGQPIADNWIYIQETDVAVGRLQVFNNWSPYLVADPATTWVGLEYFCSEKDRLWTMPDQEMIDLAKTEMVRMGMIDADDVLDGTVLRMPKAYPAYFGTYDRFEEMRTFFDQFDNLFLVGRNGMHRYNNQDHSMLTAMTAVDNIVAGRTEKSNIWDVNTEQQYHEEKAS